MKILAAIMLAFIILTGCGTVIMVVGVEGLSGNVAKEIVKSGIAPKVTIADKIVDRIEDKLEGGGDTHDPDVEHIDTTDEKSR